MKCEVTFSDGESIPNIELKAENEAEAFVLNRLYWSKNGLYVGGYQKGCLIIQANKIIPREMLDINNLRPKPF